MTLQLPGNARMAVAIGADFDAHCLWKGSLRPDQSVVFVAG